MKILKQKFILILPLFLVAYLFSPFSLSEDSMLKQKPYFTYLLETKGTFYDAKINGVSIEEDLQGGSLNYEQPVNQYMRTGSNRIGFQIFTHDLDNFKDADITISLYVNQDEATEKHKKLIGQVSFSANDFAENKNLQDAISTSMPAVNLDSSNEFLKAKDGDVIISAPKIEESKVRPGQGFYVYQDIELETPFPLWGFFSADKLDMPDAWDDFVKGADKYRKNTTYSLYSEHEKIFELLKTQDFDKILPLFSERNREMDIALYLPKGTFDKRLQKSLEINLRDSKKTLTLIEPKYAQPSWSDNKELIRLGTPAMISFNNVEDSLYSKYPIWFYKKDGEWIISR
jgi:hypothetical protein